MKSYKKTSNKVVKSLLLLFLGAATLISACKKDKGGAGPSTAPQITKVYMQGDANKEAITSALQGKTIVIEGKNLGGAQTVAFDAKVVTVDPMTNTDATIMVQIPTDTPPSTAGVLKVVTAKGSATFNFFIEKLPDPAPEIESISNENAVAGTTVTITGKHLKSVTAIKLPGNNTVTALTINSDGTQLSYTAPNMGEVSGKLTLVASAGNVETVYNVNLIKSDYNLISNLDNKSFYFGYGGSLLSSDAALYPNNTGKYIKHVIPTMAEYNFAWWDLPRNANFSAVPVWNIADHADDLAKPAENFAMKFEINTKMPWPKMTFDILTHSTAAAKIPDNGDADTRAYAFRPNTDTQVFNTNNKWVTVTIPLNKFRKIINVSGDLQANGEPVVSLNEIIGADGKIGVMQYRIFTRKGESVPAGGLEFAVDNFRIVPIK